jgi:hypothetical protein
MENKEILRYFSADIIGRVGFRICYYVTTSKIIFTKGDTFFKVSLFLCWVFGFIITTRTNFLLVKKFDNNLTIKY